MLGSSDFRPFGIVRHMTIKLSDGPLPNKHPHDEQTDKRVKKGPIDPVFAAHLDLSTKRAGGLAHQGSLLHVEGARKNNKGTRGSMQDVTGRQNQIAGATPSMHRGMGLSSFLLQNSLGCVQESSFGADPGTLTLQGRTSSQDAVPSSQWHQHHTPRQSTGTNAMLEDDHLKMLLGDASSELMLRVQKAAAALQKLWELLDTDGDGLINYSECRNILSKWCDSLASDSEKHILDNERTSESRISYSRFIDIFLPLALTVSPDLILAHLSNRFTRVPAHLQRQKTAIMHEALADNNRGSALGENKRRSSLPRRSMYGGGIPDMSAAAVPQTVGENQKRADLQRLKGTQHQMDSVDIAIGFASGTGSSAKQGSTIMRGPIANSVVPAGVRLMQGSIASSVGIAALASKPPIETGKLLSSKDKVEAIKESFMSRSVVEPTKQPGGAEEQRRKSNPSRAIKGALLRCLLSEQDAHET